MNTPEESKEKQGNITDNQETVQPEATEKPKNEPYEALWTDW